jgi:hypothetical protein
MTEPSELIAVACPEADTMPRSCIPVAGVQRHDRFKTSWSYPQITEPSALEATAKEDDAPGSTPRSCAAPLATQRHACPPEVKEVLPATVAPSALMPKAADTPNGLGKACIPPDAVHRKPRDPPGVPLKHHPTTIAPSPLIDVANEVEYPVSRPRSEIL